MLEPAALTRGRVWAYLVASFVLVACASQPSLQRAAPPPPSRPVASASPADISQLGQQGAQAAQLFRDGRFAEADAVLTSVIAAPAFPQLPENQRHALLLLGGGVAVDARDPKRGLALLQRACGMSEATGFDWYARVRAARAVPDERDVVIALTVLAVRWPDMLAKLEKSEDLDYAIGRVEKLGSESERYTALSALFGANLGRQHRDYSELWRELALLQLARGQREAAAATVQRVTYAYTAISIESDRRFDAIRGLDPWSDVTAAAAENIASASNRAQADPGELEPALHLAYLLDDSLRFAAELQVTDALIDRAEAEGSKAYSDYGKLYSYILNSRADALYALGRWDAAVIQLQAASELPEGRSSNVSQLINLAGMYAELGKPAESRATLSRVQTRAVSPYGAMQEQKITVFAGMELHDVKSVDEALRFMRQHRDDDPGALQEALLVSGHEGECARFLISRLTDPRMRSEALLAVQQYDAGVLPPWLIEKHRRWDALVARRDVQAAIARVGRVSHYPLNQQGY